MFETTTKLAKTLVAAIGLAGLLAISVTAGAVAGGAVLDVVAPTEVQAHETCEQDTCERYRVWYTLYIAKRGRCVDSPGRDTGCDMTGTHKCRTYACGSGGTTGTAGGGEDDGDDDNDEDHEA